VLEGLWESQKKKKDVKKLQFKPGMVVHTCNPSYSGGRGRRISTLKSAQAKLVRLCLKNKNTKGLGV
jgi:hypothetical protein